MRLINRAIFILFISTPAFSYEWKLVDNVPTVKINKVDCKTQAEIDFVVANATFAVVAPSNFEVSLATSGIRFSNCTDLLNCMTNKYILIDKILDAPPSVQNKFAETIDYVKKENSKK